MRTNATRSMIDLTTWVYILRCADGLYYVGTHRGEDPTRRVSQHNLGIHPTSITYRRRPVTLAWACCFADAASAIKVERQLKGWSRAKKEALMRDDWDAIRVLAKCRSSVDG